MLIKDLLEHLDNKIGDYGNQFTYFDNDCTIRNIILEIANNNVSTDYNILLKWLNDYYEYCEQALNKKIINTTSTNFWNIIQVGQYLYNEQNLYNYLDKSILYYCLHYIQEILKVSTLTENQYNDLYEFCIKVDDNKSLKDFESFCKKILEV